VERMNLVDVVQRLGIDHHFKEQIDTALKNIQGAEFNSSDLHEVSLRFRLLRQHGLWVPAGDRSLTYSLVLYHETTFHEHLRTCYLQSNDLAYSTCINRLINCCRSIRQVQTTGRRELQQRHS
jgi:hypothetical protein